MINRDIISSRIAKIRKMLNFLNKAAKMSKNDYFEDVEFQIVTERGIQIIAQAILDIGNHLISHFGWGKPETYRQVISILVSNGVLPEKIRKDLENLTGLRNILVHDYININHEILYGEIINGISSIEAFIIAIEEKY